jgi:GNAT superfamily N-acetyltransferase
MRMGRAFHAVTGAADLIPLDDATLERTFQQLIEGEASVILVFDKGDGLAGATGAMLHPHYWNNAHITGQELFWWVDPEHRGIGRALFDVLESWVQVSGAHSFTMIALEHIDGGKAGAIYRRRGYRPVEHSYTKGFN